MTAQQKYNQRIAVKHRKPKAVSRFFIVAKRQDKGLLDFMAVRYETVDWTYRKNNRTAQKLIRNCV